MENRKLLAILPPVLFGVILYLYIFFVFACVLIGYLSCCNAMLRLYCETGYAKCFVYLYGFLELQGIELLAAPYRMDAFLLLCEPSYLQNC